jgi:hypothetical protein
MTAARRSSLFKSQSDGGSSGPMISMASLAPIAAPAEEKVRTYPIAKTREGKRVATAYIEPEAHKQLARICLEEETDMQALVREGLNLVFAARNLSRIA